MVTENTQTLDDTGADDAEEQDVADFEEAFEKLDDNGEMPEGGSDAADDQDDGSAEDEEGAEGDEDGDGSESDDSSEGKEDEGGDEEETAEQKAQRLADEKAQAAAAAEWWSDLELLDPDARTKADSAEFQSWLKAQPDETRARANGTPAKAAAVLREFDAHQAEQAKGVDKGGGKDAAQPAEQQSAALPDDLPAFLEANPDLASQEIEYVDETGAKTKGTLQEFLTEKGYPDVFSAMWRVTQAAISQARGITQPDASGMQEAIEKAIADKGYVTRQDIDGISSKLADLDVIRAHNDAPQIFASKEYQDWKAKQPEPIQKLDDGTAEERIAIIDLYKQGTGGGEAAGRKAARDKLHTGTLRRGQRTGGTTKRQSTTPDNEEGQVAQFAETFDQLADDLDKE